MIPRAGFELRGLGFGVSVCRCGFHCVWLPRPVWFLCTVLLVIFRLLLLLPLMIVLLFPFPFPVSFPIFLFRYVLSLYVPSSLLRLGISRPRLINDSSTTRLTTRFTTRLDDHDYFFMFTIMITTTITITTMTTTFTRLWGAGAFTYLLSCFLFVLLWGCYLWGCFFLLHLYTSRASVWSGLDFDRPFAMFWCLLDLSCPGEFGVYAAAWAFLTNLHIYLLIF
ncbi:hypothetical protein BZA05DRAFT_209843 [Tricharina praecox]|uniref:uncharacterized protein n=1 Tax=Tricharina praecox TaxID=43433 RepID=UPI0022209AAB|nr:uncharacterized protein BZA05DRAFT_209843 [Tricharina praecox]KAI5841703.1 hypothetical protein BZA05DRAFT_209843 [Tricharina praecox]